MCGILGYISKTEGNLNESLFREALKTLNKRGPDHQALTIFNNATLGHTRLAIIDLDPRSNQPFSDPSGRYTMVFNGEIFNFLEIKQKLIARSVKFSTTSDTEVLLHAYINFGSSFIHELNGFFAFAIYDKLEDSWFLARDRFGIKPLLFVNNNDFFAFSSELKALMRFPFKKTLNKNALQLFFRFSYIPAPETILNEVHKLEAGHAITITKNKFKSYKWYTLETTEKTDINYDDAKLKTRQLLFESVQKRMISDVPLGCFLSGGIDSSVIASVASEFTNNLNTFSIGFKDQPFFDETKFAIEMAKRIKSEHTVFSLSNQDILEHYTDVLDYLDEPFADSSAINVYILSKLTRQKVTVSLSGDGADELFSGYNKHKAFFASQQSGIKNTLVKLGLPVIKQLPQSRNDKRSNLFRQLAKYGMGLNLTPEERYLLWASFMHQEQINRLVNDSKNVKNLPLLHYNRFTDVLHADFYLVLQNDMLKKVDAMSMANSLEVRTPFLDHHLVEFIFSLPDHYKINSSFRKKILRDSFEAELPDPILTRSKKGFEIPLHQWFTGELKSTLEKNIFCRQTIEDQGILNWQEVNNIKNTLFSSNPGDSPTHVWSLLVFQHWYEKNKIYLND